MNISAAVEERLLDFDDRVRTRAIIIVCDIARSNIKFVPVTLISQAAERLRDKRVFLLYVVLFALSNQSSPNIIFALFFFL